MEAECDNCAAVKQRSRPAVTLGDGMKLCAECWAKLKDDCEPLEDNDETAITV